MRSSEGPTGPAAQAAFAKKAAHVKAAKATTSALAQELIEANQELAAKSLARGEHHDLAFASLARLRCWVLICCQNPKCSPSPT